MLGSDIARRVRQKASDEIEPYRWADATDLLDAINDGIEDLYKRAPQAFVVDDIPTSAPALGALADTLLMRTAYREKLALYAASKLLSQDAEDNANLELAKFYRADYEQGLP